MEVEGQNVRIEKFNLDYCKVGKGTHNLLLIPGPSGSWRVDYQRQLQGGLRQEKFTIVGYDPPGLGRSRPPDRSYPKDDMARKVDSYNERDARIGHKLMEHLGLIPYSVLGFDDGGVTAMYIAHQQRCTKKVEKLVIWGTHAYMTSDEADLYESIRDVNTLSSEIRGPLVRLYGHKYFQTIWAKYIDIRRTMAKEWNGDICKSIVAQINQPTLILHGANDWLCPDEHPRYLVENMENAHLIVSEQGQHNLHQRQEKWFNEEVEFFLLRSVKMLQGFEKISLTKISYARVGSGCQYLLCIPGALGSWQIDYRQLLENFDHDEFTVVAMDPPGYGKSRTNSSRNYQLDTTERDAKLGHKLMKKLGLLPFSVMGFGEGGETALRIAKAAPRTVKKVIIWGTRSCVSAEDCELFKAVNDTSKWDDESKRKFVDVYGSEYFRQTWRDYCDQMCRFYKHYYHGDIFGDLLPQIIQKVLILHGAKDASLPERQAKILEEKIPNAKLIIHPEAGGNLHNEQFLWFRRCVEEFFFTDEPRTAVRQDAEEFGSDDENAPTNKDADVDKDLLINKHMAAHQQQDNTCSPVQAVQTGTDENSHKVVIS